MSDRSRSPDKLDKLDKHVSRSYHVLMPEVRITDKALRQIANLPLRTQGRIEDIIDRFEEWPGVSGAKPLRGNRKGQYRIRTGDFRVVFTVEDDIVTIEKVGHRKDVYED